MLAVLVALLVVYAWRAPDSWTGRQARFLAARLAAIRPAALIALLVLAAGLAALIAYGKAEGLFMAAQIAPEGFVWFATMDVGVAVDLLIGVWLLRARGGLRAVVQMLSVLRPPRRPRARRARRPRPPRARPANDDDPAPAWLALAA